MGKESETISAIFNPRPRVRAPSVVVTGDSPNSETSIAIPAPHLTLPTAPSHNPTIQHSDSLNSSQHGDTASVINTPDGPQMGNLPPIHRIERPVEESRWTRCKESCCSSWAKKMYFGMVVTILVTITNVGATHAIKTLYRINQSQDRPESSLFFNYSSVRAVITTDSESNAMIPEEPPMQPFAAPFFVSWFCTNLTILFFPIYLLGRAAMRKCEGPGEILGDVLRGFRDRGFTIGKFINRSIMFCLLWLFTTYFYIWSLKSLDATDSIALFATNVACVYMLSWVILQEQFVGIRIVAVILCDTGIALLAYMDGITKTPTLCGVVVAVLAAALYAVMKVMLRKILGGEAHFGQVAFTFSFIGFLNATLLWPLCIALYWSGVESMSWDAVSVSIMFILSVLLLCEWINCYRGGSVCLFMLQIILQCSTC